MHTIVRNSSFFKKIPAEAPAPQQASALPRSSPSAPTAIFPCPVPTGGGQRRAAVAPDIQQIDPDIQQNDPDIQQNDPDARGNNHPAAIAPNILQNDAQESEDEFVDAEEPEANVEPEVPQAEAIIHPGNGPAPPPSLTAFHPPLDADIAQEPFALPPDINPPRYNLRRGARELND